MYGQYGEKMSEKMWVGPLRCGSRREREPSVLILRNRDIRVKGWLRSLRTGVQSDSASRRDPSLQNQAELHLHEDPRYCRPELQSSRREMRRWVVTPPVIISQISER